MSWGYNAQGQYGWTDEAGTTNPITGVVTPQQQASGSTSGLAPQLANRGSRGQDIRYYVDNLPTNEAGRRVDAFGNEYDSGGLWLGGPRPQVDVPGLPAADANYEDWWNRRGGTATSLTGAPQGGTQSQSSQQTPAPSYFTTPTVPSLPGGSTMSMMLPPLPPPATQQGIASEVGAEIQGQVGPLESLAAGYGTAEQRAVEQLNQLFGTLQPFVQGSAERVAQAYGASSAAQQQIFGEAFNRLSGMRQQRAAEAQALAQQLGAPIPVGMFTGAIDQEQQAFAPEAAGQLLHALGIGQAGVQEAEAFAGRVFPLKRTELETQTRNYYRDKIAELNSQIASIKSMAPGMINERLRTRMLEDYNMRLDRTKTEFDMWRSKQEELRLGRAEKREQKILSLQQKEANRTWWIQRETLKVEQKRLAAQLEEIRGRLKQQNLDRTQRERLAAKERALNQQKFQADRKLQIAQAANTLWHGPSETDRKVVVPIYDPLNPVYDAQGNLIPNDQKTVTQTQPVPASKLNNPSKMLNQLLARSGTSIKAKPLYNYAVAQIINIFKARGFKGIPKNPNDWDKWWTKIHRQNKPPPPTMSPPYPPSAAGGPGG